jgi:hypothetical protein
VLQKGRCQVPVVGLLFILACYWGRLACVRTHDAEAEATDTEQGGAPGRREGEQYALTARKTRDMAVYLAIGWLFLVYTILCRTTFRSFACQDIGGFHQCRLCSLISFRSCLESR